MQKNMKRRGLSFLLILAMLFVSIAVMLPVATSADGEFTDAAVQRLESLDLANDDITTLRFLFKINNLNYSEVGFVFSKSNATPTIGGERCLKKAVTAVYSSINAGGDPVEAGTGLFWVAIQMTDIPHEYFDGTLYARPYVIDAGGGAPRYDDVLSTTVCTVAGHVHQVRELKQEMIGGTASLNTVGTKIGTCAGCNLEVTISGVKTQLEFKKFVGGGAADRWIESHKISSILGDKHFYPTNDNPTGNDLYAEYSILWNETLLNLSPTVNKGARVEMRFSPSDDEYGASSNAKAIAYYSLTDNVTNAGTKIAGAFEYPCDEINTSLTDDPYPRMCQNNTYGGFGNSYEHFANVGGTDQDHPEWGWHRIGVRYHQEVSDATPLVDVAAGTVDAEYELTVEVYIDGVLVSRLGGTDLAKGGNDYKLYTVKSNGNGGLDYKDMNGNIWFNTFMLDQFSAPTYDAYFIDGDFFVTAGHGFVQNVTRIDNPAARTETIDGKTFTAPFYYTTVGTHDHAWGELVDDASPAADCGHAATQSIHCTVCGETKPGSTVDLPIDPSLHVYGAYETIRVGSLLGDGIERRTCVNCGGTDDRALTATEATVATITDSTTDRYDQKATFSSILSGGKHFYPAASNNYEGNDLLIEYSLLWNNTLANLNENADDGYQAIVNARIGNSSGGSNPNDLIWLSLKANTRGSDCTYAGGFEYGGLRTVEVGPANMSTTKPSGNCPGSAYADFPNIGGTNQASPEWGWHRVQIRYHQELTNEDGVKNNSETPAYRLYVECSIDGVLLFRNSNAASDTYTDTNWNSKNLLFTVSKSNTSGSTLVNGLYYKDIDTNRYIHGLRVPFAKTNSGTAYFVYGDYACFAGRNFIQDVEPALDPTVATIPAVGYGLPTNVYYQFK